MGLYPRDEKNEVKKPDVKNMTPFELKEYEDQIFKEIDYILREISQKA